MQVIESENQVENAATEDVSQTDVDDDIEVLERENQTEQDQGASVQKTVGTV